MNHRKSFFFSEVLTHLDLVYSTPSDLGCTHPRSHSEHPMHMATHRDARPYTARCQGAQGCARPSTE